MRNLRDYSIITGTYWIFTLTDGALRMLVLLYLHQLGYSPLKIASLFLLYEFFGVLTNLMGGYLGSRFGLKTTLFAGLCLQIVACAMLTANPQFLTVFYVMVAQGLSGIAKDLTKMSSKSYIKLVVPHEDQHGLMKWVSILTGSKNTLKGVGFFLGAFMLTQIGFQNACLAMAVGLFIALIGSIVLLPKAPGKSQSKVKFSSILSQDPKINWLSGARFFLFGSRDIWFVLALPIFLSTTLSWSFDEVGGFLALWIIGYGFIQAMAPYYVGGSFKSHVSPPTAKRLSLWTALLILPLIGISVSLGLHLSPTAILLFGLSVFGILFATNSAIHSYLVIAYSDGDKVALNVGFYYMANAGGRLVGTILSGALFQWGGQGSWGLSICIMGSIVFVVLSNILCLPLQKAEKAHPVMGL